MSVTLGEWTTASARGSMVTMTVMPRDHPWTVADLAALPDDGLRYELVEGCLLVSQSPGRLHQRVIANLMHAVRSACPNDMEVFLPRTSYQPSPGTALQPDLLVVSRDDPWTEAVTNPLILAVEVLTPSSRSVDRVLKRALYEQAGVSSYWIVDPEEPSIAVGHLVDGRYGEPAVASGDTALSLELPFPMNVVPAALVIRTT